MLKIRCILKWSYEGSYLPIKFTRNFSNENSETFKQNTKYDVIISGGGMVGTAMTCALGQSPRMTGKKILLLEGASLRTHSHKIKEETYSNRVSALTPATKHFMESVGVWETIVNSRYQCIKRMQVWDACCDTVITFNYEDMSKNVGYIVENNIIIDAFVRQLEKMKDRVEIHDYARVASYELPKETTGQELVKVAMKNGEVYETKLLIGADGNQSLVRNAMNVNYVQWSYNQMAVVATLHLSESTENVVGWQRFLPNSTIALLPLTDKLSSLVWSTSLPHAKRLLSMPEEDFVDSVNKALWDDTQMDPTVNSLLQSYAKILRSIIPEGTSIKQLPPSVTGVDSRSRVGFALGFGHSTNYVGQRVALIGDSAHRVHPHAGLGVNLGFGDVLCLSKVLEKAVYDGADMGAITSLVNYETLRQWDVVPVCAAVDVLHRLYKTNFLPVVFMRGIGLFTTNSLYPVKVPTERQTTSFVFIQKF